MQRTSQLSLLIPLKIALERMELYALYCFGWLEKKLMKSSGVPWGFHGRGLRSGGGTDSSFFAKVNWNHCTTCVWIRRMFCEPTLPWPFSGTSENTNEASSLQEADRNPGFQMAAQWQFYNVPNFGTLVQVQCLPRRKCKRWGAHWWCCPVQTFPGISSHSHLSLCVGRQHFSRAKGLVGHNCSNCFMWWLCFAANRR